MTACEAPDSDTWGREKTCAQMNETKTHKTAV